MRSFVLFILSFIVFLPSLATAQESKLPEDNSGVKMFQMQRTQRTIERNSRLFNESIDVIYEKPNLRRQYVIRLRSFYPSQLHYTPLAEDVIKDLTYYAYLADTAEAIDQRNQALNDYKDLFKQHMPNLGVLNYAITLARANPQYGNETFLTEIKTIIETYLTDFPYDCRSPENACTVITFEEETFFLTQKAKKILKSELVQAGVRYYNVHDVINKAGENEVLYFEVTKPIKSARENQLLLEKQKELKIRPQ
ncbi:MAG: hypothetical protein GC137_06175 [Alphaproteobacteria bacterium]|nr:hypothetical protein [Alphaproteobacteria bacterium]